MRATVASFVSRTSKGRPEPRRSPVASRLSLFDDSIMTNLVRYLTYPQVQIDPAVPVPLWGLNEVGRGRTAYGHSRVAGVYYANLRDCTPSKDASLRPVCTAVVEDLSIALAVAFVRSIVGP
jgi:hypothetical protein